MTLKEIYSDVDYLDSIDKDEYYKSLVHDRLEEVTQRYSETLDQDLNLILSNISKYDIITLSRLVKKFSRKMCSSYNTFIDIYISLIKSQTN